LAYALLQYEPLANVLVEHGVNVEKIKEELEESLTPKGEAVSEVTVSPQLKSVLERAADMARNTFRGEATPEQLLFAILEDGGYAASILERNNLKLNNLMDISRRKVAHVLLQVLHLTKEEHRQRPRN